VGIKITPILYKGKKYISADDFILWIDNATETHGEIKLKEVSKELLKQLSKFK